MIVIRKLVFIIICISVLLWGGFVPPLQAEPVAETLKKDFPAFDFDGVMTTPIKGIYAVVYAGHEVVYYLPESGILITGEMIARGGVNMTEEVRGEIMSRYYKEIPLERGIKIGSGSHTVVEITDPDCPYCRNGSRYFADRPDVTRYVFFWPLSPESEQKVRHILCAADRVKMYEDVMAGAYDDGKALNLCREPAVDELLAAYRDLGMRIGMTGTPIFFVNGRAVRGANIPLIEAMLVEDAAKAEKALQTPAAPAPQTETPKAPEAPKKP